MTKIFISYAATQADVAVQLHDRLAAAGYDTWVYAVHGDRGTSTDEIMPACDMQVVIMDSKAASSPNVRIEIKRFHAAGKPIIPLMLEPLMLPDEIDKSLAVYDMDDLDDAAARLIDQIERVLASRAEQRPTGTIMLSYPRSESTFATKLNTALKSAGYSTWFYADDQNPRQNRDEQIAEVLKEAEMQIVIVTKRAVDLYGGMRMEFEAMAIMGKPIIPVMLYPTELPKQLQAVPPVYFTINFDRGMADLQQTIERVQNLLASERVLVAYHDLMGESSTMGPTNVSRTIADYLPGKGYSVETVDFTGASYDDTLRDRIDNASAFVIILSRTTIAYMTNETDPLRVALQHAMDTDKTIIPVAISRKRNLLGVEPFEPFQYPVVYIPPVYLPPENAEKTLAPLMAQLEGKTMAAIPAPAAPEAPAGAAPEPAATLPLKDGLTHHIFLSYKRMDGDTMRRVRDDLRKQGFVVWTDELIEKGTPQWQREIEQAIRGTATLVCLLSPEAAQSDYVREE
ncbi:MAG: toll/interleukin-1 receptor domain-containing protein, partial [Chloroflexota bacterium]